MMRHFVHLLENSNRRIFNNHNNNLTSFISQYTFASTTKSGKISGVCKWWDNKKGYGFITLDDGSGDVFVHQTNIQKEGFRSLADGEALEFNVETVDGKRAAVNVTGPNGSPVQGAPFQQRTGGFERSGGGFQRRGGDFGDNDRRRGGGGGGNRRNNRRENEEEDEH